MQRNIAYTSLFFVLFGFALAGYGTARSTSRELLECSLRMKEDTLRLVEAGDELNDALRKVAGHDSDDELRVVKAEERGQRLLIEIEAQRASLTECDTLLHGLQRDLGDGLDHNAGFIGSLRSVHGDLLLLDEVAARFEDLKDKITSMNEIVFKAQLVSVNASIEANRAGQLSKGYALIGAEIQLLSENTDQVAREISELAVKTQKMIIEAAVSLRTRLSAAERDASDCAGSLVSIRDNLPRVAGAMQQAFESLQRQDQLVGRISETIERVEFALVKAGQIRSEVNRHVQDVRQQSYRIEDLVQDLGHAVKGARTRSRLKKSLHQEEPMFSRGLQVSSEQARADAVDRLAQKMRPRLVVESNVDEPEVSDAALNPENERRAG